MLEQKIDALIVAVEALTAAVKGNLNAGEVKAETTEKAEKQEPEPKVETATLEDARAALVKMSKEQGNAAAKEALASFNAKKLGDMNASDYAKLIAMANDKAAA